DRQTDCGVGSRAGRGGPVKRCGWGGRGRAGENLARALARRWLAGGGRRFKGLFDRLLEGRQCRLDRLLRQIAGDEYYAGAAVLARPLRQQHRWVKEMLNAVQDHRLVRPVAERHDRLETEQVVAA